MSSIASISSPLQQPLSMPTPQLEKLGGTVELESSLGKGTRVAWATETLAVLRRMGA